MNRSGFKRLAIGLLLVLLAGSVASAASKGRAPAWAREVAATPTPADVGDALGVILLHDSRRLVNADGRVTATSRHVVRILKLDGRELARAAVPYSSDYQKITAFEAWLILPDGTERVYARKEAVDVAQDLDQIFTEGRVLALSAVDSVVAGAVFGYSYGLEEKSVFTQDLWSFQSTLPVVLSRVTYELPRDWTIKSTTFAHAPVEPVQEGQRYTWELRDLAPVPDEDHGPSLANMAAALALDLRPPEKAASRRSWRMFDTWQDVSRYEAELHDARAVPDAAITAKARELTAGAATQFDGIKAIGAYVAKVNYASVQKALGRGGGHTPNPAAQVFKRHYGDCKDKTVLMRALLAATGVKSYSTIAFAQERREIVEAWPSPFQFDHCIVAVAVDDSVDAPAVVTHPELGRLLIYDPTNALGPPGDLLTMQQGVRVLVGAGTPHDLVRLPDGEPEHNRLERRLEAKMDRSGAISATVTEQSVGAPAQAECRDYRGATSAQYHAIVQRWISRGARLAKVSRVDAKDHVTESGAFDLRVEFTAQNFAQAMGTQLLVFKPAVVPRRVYRELTDAGRQTPVILAPSQFEETIDVELPAGFVVDEMPEAVQLSRPFAEFSLVGERRDGRLVFRRMLLIRAAEIPVERYEEVRSFFAGINRAEQTPVVLKRE